MTPLSREVRVRAAMFEALKVAAPVTFNSALRHAFMVEASNLELAQLEMDSLSRMEFCISVELSTGISLLPAELALFHSTDAIQAFLLERSSEKCLGLK